MAAPARLSMRIEPVTLVDLASDSDESPAQSASEKSSSANPFDQL